ncbi:hypothetical protein MXB_3548 [Myxobolus squamalis]|nr:hypothetical protein MXB_3548 [Myxobolus squamalis]
MSDLTPGYGLNNQSLEISRFQNLNVKNVDQTQYFYVVNNCQNLLYTLPQIPENNNLNIPNTNMALGKDLVNRAPNLVNRPPNDDYSYMLNSLNESHKMNTRPHPSHVPNLLHNTHPQQMGRRILNCPTNSFQSDSFIRNDSSLVGVDVNTNGMMSFMSNDVMTHDNTQQGAYFIYSNTPHT